MLMPATALAQVEEGDKELSLSGMFITSMGDADFSALTCTVGYGSFFNENTEAGVFVTAQLAGADDMSGALYISPFLTHYVRPDDPKQTPYVGGRAGIGAMSSGDELKVQESLLLTAYGGMKWWLSEKTTFFLEGDYLFFLGGDAGEFMGPGDGMLMALVGMSVLF